MRKTSVAVLALVFMFSSLASAATVSTGPIVSSASVDDTLTLTVVLREDSSTGTVVTDIAFGELADIGTGTLRSDGSVVAMITVNSHGIPYTVTQDGIVMSNGSDTLPTGACVVTPVYASEDNGGVGAPAGSSLGSGGTFVSTGKVVFSSGPSGELRTVQAHYAVTDDPAAGSTGFVPLDQPGGLYAGTVTISVTA